MLNFGIKKGFTLTEVLVTLGIIGIVAAMTLPTLIHNHRIKVLETGFKKSYANLQNAYNLTKESLGGVNIYSTYVKYDADVGNYVNANIFINEFYKNIKVVKTVNFYPITNYTGTKVTTRNEGYDFPVATKILPDGSSVGITIWSGAIQLYIDSNGPYKGPNRYGFDVFRFHVNSNDAIVPVKQTRQYTDDELSAISQVMANIAGYPCNKYNLTQKGNGMGCSYYAVNDINPENNSKGYWKNLP